MAPALLFRLIMSTNTLAHSPSSKPVGSICVTTLIENSVYGRDLQAEHGLAFHIRTERHSVLFDTGQSDLLVRNARNLGIDLDDVEAVVLSHGHYDHTGGLKAVRDLAPASRLYLNPSALVPKFAGNSDGTSRAVGLPDASALVVRQSSKSLVWTIKPTEILDGIFVTGEIPRQNSFEDTGGRFFLDEGCLKPDPLLDDQAIYFDTDDGLVVLMGCAHAGVVNTVQYIQQISNGRPVYALLGGFHLLEANQERLAKTLETLDTWAIQRIAAAHCTGVAATARLWTAFPNRCCSCSVGTRLVFRRS